MSGNPENPSVQADQAAEDHHGVVGARAIIKCLARFIHGKKIYAKNNPTLTKFAKEFDKELRAFFEDHDELVLSIEKYRMKWNDEVVYENEKRDESIAFLLYKDGIGELSIQRPVAFDEIEKLVDLIKNEIHNFQNDEDIVTKFWKADFENISYRVLDEYLVGQFGEGRPEEAEKTPFESEDHPDLPSFDDRGRVIESKESLESIVVYLNQLVDRSAPQSGAVEREKRFQDMADSFFLVSDDEFRRCREELEREKNDDTLVRFQKDIIDFTLLQDNPSVVRDASNIIEGIVDFLVEEGNMDSLGATLAIVRGFLKRSVVGENVRSFFESMEEKLTTPDLLQSLVGSIRHPGADAGTTFRYLAAVGKPAVTTICSLLEDLDGAELHRLACDTLIEIAGDDIHTVVDKLKIDVPRVAQDVVYLMEKCNLDELPEQIDELMYYPDNRVRVAIIGYLAEADSDRAAELLALLIDDADQHIRMKALSAAAAMQSPVMRDKLVAVAFGNDLGNRSFAEQEMVFTAAGRLAGDAILPDLVRMARKKSRLPFAKQQIKESKLLAIRALENMDSDAAYVLMEELARDQNDLVKSRARKVLNATQEIQGGE